MWKLLPLFAVALNARTFTPRLSGATGTPEFQFPNGLRFLPKIRDGRLRPVDANPQKPVFLIERIRLSLQLRAFNVLNQVCFGGPSVITAGCVVDNASRAEACAKIYF